MRALYLLPALLLVAACGEKEATEEVVPETTAPAALTAAAVSGTWTGMTMTEGVADSTTWTATSTSDSTGTLTLPGIPDPVGYTVMFDADSAIFTTFPFVDPSRDDGMMVKERSVGRLQADGQMVGSYELMLVGSDSVIARGTWHGSRAPM